MQWKPNVTVAAIARRDGRYLLVEEQADDAVVLNQPAGHVERDEGLLAAVAREVLEETAWEFLPLSLVGTYYWRNPGNDTTYLRFCFAGEVGTHDPHRALDEGILGTVWLTRPEIEAQVSRHRSPMVLACIEDYESGQSFPLRVLRQL